MHPIEEYHTYLIDNASTRGQPTSIGMLYIMLDYILTGTVKNSPPLTGKQSKATKNNLTML